MNRHRRHTHAGHRQRAIRRPRICRTTSSPSSRGPTATTCSSRASITNGPPPTGPMDDSSATSGAKSGTTSPASINGVEISRGGTDRFNFNYALGHTAILAPSMFLDVKGSWLRFNDDLQPIGQLDPSELGLPGQHARALRRLQPHPAILHRVGHADDRRPRRDARGAAERVQYRPAPAVLQPAVHADADLDLGQSHRQVRLRLARAPADGNQPGLAGRRVRVRQRVHAASSTAVAAVRPGHRGVHARAFPPTTRSSSCARSRTTASSTTASSSTTTGASATG